MSLISVTFRNITIGLVILVAVATFLLWNRIPGPRAVRVAGRSVLLVVGEFLGIVALLVTLNISYGGLVVSWGDLMGDQSVDGAHMTGQAGEVTMKPVAKVAARSITRALKFTHAGNGFIRTTLKGSASGVSAQVYVWLPPGYDRHPGTYYPVLELLHGVPDSPGAWMTQMHVATRMKSAIATGTVHPFILVIPVVTPYADHSSPRDDEECTDLSSHDRIETWVTQDVRNMVLSQFRAISAASGWGLMGYSTGGFCAANLLLRHPDRYKAGVSISGYYSPESPPVTADAALAQENDPIRRVRETTTPPVSLLMTASAQDPVDPPSEPQALIDAARANPRSRSTEIQQYIAPLGGGHNQSAWEKMLPTAFRWFTQRLSGPVTAS
jgi:enterochelin esterase-like enzyme